MKNIFHSIPENLRDEVFEQLLETSSVRIERIISSGHVSPVRGWYDQTEDEWVLVLQGAAKILFDDGTEFPLNAGDHMTIPAHQKHRVSWTDPGGITIWLAVFYCR